MNLIFGPINAPSGSRGMENLMSGSISVDYVSHQFSKNAEVVLADISLTVKAGELVSLIGRSGCGKSTLLHVISGLLMPAKGCVRIDGRTVTRPSAQWNMMFQKASLFPWMSVRQNVGLGLKFAGASKQQVRQRTDELLELVGLTDKAQDSIQSLSGGQQQRIALARSLATAPTVLLLDEPFSALDLKAKNDAIDLICQLNSEEQLAVLVVSHDHDDARRLNASSLSHQI